ncbi:uncharacterized protein LOC112347722 [Selaginella moellendorffii]|uniref:uncharacterized protein LOC112347722 n=1 Tax=Selaginella moellendorffii TaxID=88036 RepID=UPI000D1C3397|nr:uncharacterized protein LOC112347722 [Selaginella moellendorffii]|eukprot:XP_024534834.1 uncharacterized protein LOC112347722 [Selaginella moellendorffii]
MAMAAFHRHCARSFHSSALLEAASAKVLRKPGKLAKKSLHNKSNKEFDPEAASKRLLRLLELKESLRIEVEGLNNLLKLPKGGATEIAGLMCREEMEQWYARKRSEELASLKSIIADALREDERSIASAVNRCEAKLDALIGKKDDRLLRKLSRFWYGP